MSLTVREQQALDGLASRLAGSDPVLAAKLAIFNRLTSGEAMPARESTRLARAPVREGTLLAREGTVVDRGNTRFAGWARRLSRRLGLRGVAALLWLVIAVALIGIAVAFSSGAKSNGACTTSWPLACAARSASSPG
jgi:hypothetical protein